jgi:hypothetical protein
MPGSFMMLDAMERGSWNGRQEGIQPFEGREAARMTANNVATLLDLCGDPDRVMQAVQEWAEARQSDLEASGDEKRSSHVAGLWLTIGLNGVGNLFGYVPEDALSYDLLLADEGRARGWRK